MRVRAFRERDLGLGLGSPPGGRETIGDLGLGEPECPENPFDPLGLMKKKGEVLPAEQFADEFLFDLVQGKEAGKDESVAIGKERAIDPVGYGPQAPGRSRQPPLRKRFPEPLMKVRQILEAGPGAVGEEVGPRSGHGVLNREIDAAQSLALDPGRRQFLEIVVELDPKGEEMVGRQEAVTTELFGGAPLDFEKEGDGVEDVDRSVAAAEPLGIDVIHERVEGFYPRRDEAPAEALGQRLSEVISRPALGEDDPGPGKISPGLGQSRGDGRDQARARRNETDPGGVHSTTSNRR